MRPDHKPPAFSMISLSKEEAKAELAHFRTWRNEAFRAKESDPDHQGKLLNHRRLVKFCEYLQAVIDWQEDQERKLEVRS